MAYALIIVPSATRAAQCGFLLEKVALTPVTCRNEAETLFHVERLGPPALIISEAALPDGDGLSLLKKLRQRPSFDKAPAIIIVESRQAHESAARQMIQLGISSLMLGWHKLPALEKAIRNALSLSQPPEPAPPAAFEPPSDGAAAALAVAERLADDPMVGDLAMIPLFESGNLDEDLSRVVAATARALGAPLAMLWVNHRERSWFRLHPDALPGGARAPAMWAPLRAAIGTQPIHVGDVGRSPSLAVAPPVRSRLLGSFAGAPLLGTDGQAIGAVAVAHPQPDGIPAATLEPLVFWASRIASEMSALVAPRAPAGAEVSAPAAIESAMSALASAILVTDRSGTICFANSALRALLAVRVVRVAGLPRADILRALGASEEVKRAITGATGSPEPLQFQVTRPEPRVLRWESREITLGSQTGRLDEFRDVTASAALSRVDAPTGLPDRRGADEILGREIARALRTVAPLGVALFEVDGLASQPPELAERIFRSVAWVLRESLRGYDVAARFGPAQLLAALPGASAEQVRGFGERFCREVREMWIEGLPKVTVSGGTAQLDPVTSVDAMLESAGARLADAKTAGGDRTF